ncbi:Sec-independent protein translocase protein TatB [Novosphingobium colocasiae]|uniref:Sec-independent protein translocase protein TatB n=1 Tax=Novosphingobium colocasiae TaxID=1256513 RepID=A0A918PGC4_9SPHN|nr:Sec-independent protein translocase protein TatB [Novosphingobium colocasiae]GGZ04633.1 hypothetical protein GCM10011614_19310 [Novosphingobium colocasiae]
MFDIGASELLMIVIVAVVVIGPKDMPRALRTAGRWIGKMRKVSNHFRAGIDAMVREAELEELERKWREQNEAILKAHPQTPTLAEVESAPVQFGQIAHHETEMEPIAPPVAAPDAPPADEPVAAPSTTALPPP